MSCAQFYPIHENPAVKYRVLFDYGMDGHKFLTDGHSQPVEYDDITEAVRAAIGYHTDFLIVQVIAWKVVTSE
jgi:hypothetical protein